MLRNILVIALCVVLISCKGIVESYKRSNSGTSALEKTVFVDFRNPVTIQVPAITPNTWALIRSHVPECRMHSDPKLTSVVHGSFTYAAETETAYLVASVCGTANQLQVYSGDKFAASADTPFTGIITTSDLNHDDQNELLMTVQTTHNGVTDREASLQDFEKNSLHPVEEFGTVYHDPCASFAGLDAAKKQQFTAGGLSPSVEAVVVYYLPRPGHQMPSFTVERYRAPCPSPPGAAPTAWTRIGMR